MTYRLKSDKILVIFRKVVFGLSADGNRLFPALLARRAAHLHHFPPSDVSQGSSIFIFFKCDTVIGHWRCNDIQFHEIAAIKVEIWHLIALLCA